MLGSKAWLEIMKEMEPKTALWEILVIGEDRLGVPPVPLELQLQATTDLDRLERMILCAEKATSRQEILDTL